MSHIPPTPVSRFLHFNEQYGIPASDRALDRLLTSSGNYSGALNALDRDSFATFNRAKTLIGEGEPGNDAIKPRFELENDQLVLKADQNTFVIPNDKEAGGADFAQATTASRIEQLREANLAGHRQAASSNPFQADFAPTSQVLHAWERLGYPDREAYAAAKAIYNPDGTGKTPSLKETLEWQHEVQAVSTAPVSRKQEKAPATTAQLVKPKSGTKSHPTHESKAESASGLSQLKRRLDNDEYEFTAHDPHPQAGGPRNTSLLMETLATESISPEEKLDLLKAIRQRQPKLFYIPELTTRQGADKVMTVTQYRYPDNIIHDGHFKTPAERKIRDFLINWHLELQPNNQALHDAYQAISDNK